MFFRKDLARIFHTEWKLKSEKFSREISSREIFRLEFSEWKFFAIRRNFPNDLKGVVTENFPTGSPPDPGFLLAFTCFSRIVFQSQRS